MPCKRVVKNVLANEDVKDEPMESTVSEGEWDEIAIANNTICELSKDLFRCKSELSAYELRVADLEKQLNDFQSRFQQYEKDNAHLKSELAENRKLLSSEVKLTNISATAEKSQASLAVGKKRHRVNLGQVVKENNQCSSLSSEFCPSASSTSEADISEADSDGKLMNTTDKTVQPQGTSVPGKAKRARGSALSHETEIPSSEPVNTQQPIHQESPNERQVKKTKACTKSKMTTVPKARGEVCRDLPNGWKFKAVQRLTGATAGKFDVYYFSPCNKKFRTKIELQQYVTHNNIQVDINFFDFSLNSLKTKGFLEVSDSPAPPRGRPPKSKARQKIK